MILKDLIGVCTAHAQGCTYNRYVNCCKNRAASETVKGRGVLSVCLYITIQYIVFMLCFINLATQVHICAVTKHYSNITMATR